MSGQSKPRRSRDVAVETTRKARAYELATAVSGDPAAQLAFLQKQVAELERLPHDHPRLLAARNWIEAAYRSIRQLETVAHAATEDTAANRGGERRHQGGHVIVETKGLRVDLTHAVWKKSSHSEASGCVEVASVDGAIAVRDSKDRSGPTLIYTPAEWEAFIGGVRDGEFD